MSNFEYHKEGTARLAWKKGNTENVILHVNPYEPPTNDPEINATLQAVSKFGGMPEDYSVYTLDFENPRDVEAIENMLKAINAAPNTYITRVNFDENEEFSGVSISSENPNPEFATFDPEKFDWTLPPNYDEILEDRELEQQERDLLSELSTYESKAIRPMTSLVEALLLGEEPSKTDLAYFSDFQSKKNEVRNKMSNVKADRIDRAAKRAARKPKK